MENYCISHIRSLEAESIHIIREVAATFERPVMLYSIGKDSSVMVRLAQKAFFPGKLPFPLLHIDTSMKFKEMYAFRDHFAEEIKADLRIYSNKEALEQGVNPWEQGTAKCCSILKTQALLNALKAGRYDAALAGARRDEESSRAKERIFSLRDQHGQWEPRSQRPELWNLYNTSRNNDESMRVFPLSNWTEMDVWEYIHREKIPVVSLYFAKERDVLVRKDCLIPYESSIPLEAGETPQRLRCRFKTLGCYPCTGAIPSSATTIPEILNEMRTAQHSERVARVIDHDQHASMERKKSEGYF